MDFLIFLGGVIVVIALAVVVWPIVCAIAVIAFLSWAIGIPFWVGLIIGGLIGVAGAIVAANS